MRQRRGPVRMLLDALQLVLFDLPVPEATRVRVPASVAGTKEASGREVVLDGRRVAYRLRRSRRRSIGFRIDETGLLVSAPQRLGLAAIENGIVGKRRWILAKLAEREARRDEALGRQTVWADGAELDYLGSKLRVELANVDAEHRLATDGDFASPRLQLALPATASAAQIREATHDWLQQRALALFAQRCAHYAPRLGVAMPRLALSHAKTRWGSASSGGAIRLHWRLIHFPLDVLDYVVVHELAHLREMNHGARFWALVRSALPTADAARVALREHRLVGFD